MSVRQLLRKKRDGEELTKKEIEFFIQEMVNGNVAESQIGKLNMICCVYNHIIDKYHSVV